MEMTGNLDFGAADVELTGVLAQEQAENWPEPDIDSDDPPASGPGESAPGPDPELTDRFGNPFDPTIHQTTEDGRPSVTKTGKCRLKPGVDPLELARGSYVPPTDEAGPGTLLGQPAGKLFSSLFITGSSVLLGPDWLPNEDPELAAREVAELERAFQDVADLYGLENLGPRGQLAAVLGGYALARVGKPRTISRFGLIWRTVCGWCGGFIAKLKFGNLFSRKKPADTGAEGAA